jgi:L-aminopeptidase/D-esterase-like protein
MSDGDTVFALATGGQALSPVNGPFGGAERFSALDRLCAAAADVFARAIVHALLSATSVPGLPAYRDLWPGALAG